MGGPEAKSKSMLETTGDPEPKSESTDYILYTEFRYGYMSMLGSAGDPIPKSMSMLESTTYLKESTILHAKPKEYSHTISAIPSDKYGSFGSRVLGGDL